MTQYVVIHTHGVSVECVLGCGDLQVALAKAHEVAVRSGFFDTDDFGGIDQKEAIKQAKEDLERDGFCDGWDRGGTDYDQRVTVKRMFRIY